MRHTTGSLRNFLDRPRTSLVPPGVGLVWLRPRGRNMRWQWWQDSRAVMRATGRTTSFFISLSYPPKLNTGSWYSGPSRFSRTEVEAPRAVVTPHSEPLTISRSPTVPPLAPPLSPSAVLHAQPNMGPTSALHLWGSSPAGPSGLESCAARRAPTNRRGVPK
jgi:hypothetical protein